MVRRRAGPLRRDDPASCATCACSSATATRSRWSGSCCCCCRALPGIGEPVNGAYLGIKIGPVAFQPAEFGKLAIIIFLAVLPARHAAGARAGRSEDPRLHAAAAAARSARCSLVWGAAMLMLIFIRDLGSSLMYFGGFLALLYVATNRPSFVLVGLILFALGAWFMAHARPARPGPRRRLAGPVQPALGPGRPATRSRSRMFAQADGGLVRHRLRRVAAEPSGGTTLIPAPQTDLIYAVIVNELGLVGACGLILVYLLFAERGFKTAMLATDSFSKLLAAGLTSVFALQVFVIVGGVTRVIPLTGVTLPFVSYGGSSIMANFVLLALLLIVSDQARRPAAGSNGRRRPVNKPVGRLFVLVVVLFAVLVGFTSRWTVFDAQALRENPANHRILLAGGAHQARGHPRRRRHRAGRVAPDRAGALRPPLSDERPVRPPGRLLLDRPRARRPRGLLQRRAVGPRDDGDRRDLAAARPAGRGRRPQHDALAGRPEGGLSRGSTGRAGAVVALDIKTGRGAGDGGDAVLRPERPEERARPSTARRRAATRRARRSRR